MNRQAGKVIVPADLNVWPHEYHTALSLAKAGYVVEFIHKRTNENERSADIIISGREWEMKAPRSANIKAIERNLKRARCQSDNVVFDSRRMKQIPDEAIMRELQKHIQGKTTLTRLLFVNRHGEVIDIVQ